MNASCPYSIILLALRIEAIRYVSHLGQVMDSPSKYHSMHLASRQVFGKVTRSRWIEKSSGPYYRQKSKSRGIEAVAMCGEAMSGKYICLVSNRSTTPHFALRDGSRLFSATVAQVPAPRTRAITWDGGAKSNRSETLND